MKRSELNAATQARMGMKQFKAKRSKYGVAPKADRTIDGITFDSKKEMVHYVCLKSHVVEGIVKYFLRQVPFHLPGNVVYRADFMVFMRDGSVEVRDVKGMKTAMYRLKKKQVEALYPVKIIEV